MKLNTNEIKLLKQLPKGGYDKFKVEFLYHSNKMEGSTFNKAQIIKVLNDKVVEGTHSLNDVYETRNSLELFDFLINTIDEPLTPNLIKDYHAILMRDSDNEINKKLGGTFRPFDVEISGVDLQLSPPINISDDLNKCIYAYNHSDKNIDAIAKFHSTFEQIHPFHDGNGRVGRFIILKQCVINNIDLIAIDSEFETDYKKALFKSQKYGLERDLIDVFKSSQLRLDLKMKNFKSSLDYVKKEAQPPSKMKNDDLTI